MSLPLLFSCIVGSCPEDTNTRDRPTSTTRRQRRRMNSEQPCAATHTPRVAGTGLSQFYVNIFFMCCVDATVYATNF